VIRSRSGLPRTVFVDTSAFYATTDRASNDTSSVRRILARLIDDQVQLVTTNFVVAELHALLLSRGNRHVALTTVQELRLSPSLTIERVNELDEERAWEIIERYDDKDFAFADAASFAVMERLEIFAAVSLDRHFAQFGWTIISEP